jgi:8-oxo-dGTP pyrophosphatase MutT (NUDIX family)
MYNNWTTHTTTEVYSNPWIQVTHRSVTTPANTPGIYGVVHFKNLAIGIIPLDNEYNTWLVGQWRYTLNAFSWEIPEGGCPLGTPPLQTAQRELKEETGIIANRWTPLLNIHTSNSVTDEYGHVFVAQDLLFENPEPEETEALHIRKLPFDQAVQMVMDNTITDSLSIAAILKLKILIDQKKI